MKNFWMEESGQGMVEYTLIAFLVAIAAVAGFSALGRATNNSISNTASSFPK